MIKVESLVISQSVDYAVLEPAQESAPQALLICLHGWGQACEKFIRLFVPLRSRNLLVVAPQAPHPFYVKWNPKTVGFTWLTMYERDRAVQEFISYMALLLEKTAETHAFPQDRIFLLGFSQGVSMAYRFAVSGRAPIAGLIACGADMPPDVAEMLPRTHRFPVFLSHGREDSIVAADKAFEAARILTRNNYPVEKFFFPGGHEIPADAVEKIGDWIAEQSSRRDEG